MNQGSKSITPPNFSWLLITVLFFNFPVCAQEHISGTVYSAKDSTALSGVSVYFDGTSIGTVTNDLGNFSLEGVSSNGAGLVFSFLGYERIVLPTSQISGGELPPVFLKEGQEELEEVFIENDPWNRARKLSIFKKEFLGRSLEAAACKIRNENVLELRYVPSKDILVATASEPLNIVNRHLGYEITYDLENFEVHFRENSSGLRMTHFVYYEGFSFFEELRKRTRRKFINNREQVYKGSTLHFMRALRDSTLHDNGFRIFHEKFEVPPYKFFKFQDKGGLVKVTLLEEKLSILFNDLFQSSIQATGPFFVDTMGNHTPPSAVIMGGEMGTKRISQLLPLNYKQQSQ